MAVAFVRAHNGGGSNNSGGWLSQGSLAAAVPAGRVLVMAFGLGSGSTGSAHAVTGISKPVGETNDWAKIAGLTGSYPAASVELWAIKTTMEWPSATAVTATTNRTDLGRCYTLREFSGADVDLRSTPGSSALAGHGDLAIGVGAYLMPSGGTFGGDSDTTGGSWVSGGLAAGGYPGSTGDFIGVYSQHKIPGIDSTQDYDPQATGSLTPAGRRIVAVLKSTNVAPYAPTLTAMEGGASYDNGVANRARWEFADPNAFDSQSAASVRYRLVGAGSWTTVAVGSPNSWYDFAAGLAAGGYEWQAAVTDALGLTGPWSTSGFFTMVDGLPGLSITAPVNGGTVGAVDTIVWSTPNQDSYQLRRVGDDDGDPDPTTVYFDTGEVLSSSTRDLELAFDVNNRVEHLQVRVKFEDLWSEWASVEVDVSFTPVPAPSFVLVPDVGSGSLMVVISNPASGEDEQAAVYNDVFVDDGPLVGTGGEERRVTGVSPNGSWRYWTPVSGRDYSESIRVVAVAADGSTSSSEGA